MSSSSPKLRELHPGVRVVCAGQWHGVVVFNSATGEYGRGWSAAEFVDLGPGFMVRYDEVGLVFQPEPDEDLEIVAPCR